MNVIVVNEPHGGAACAFLVFLEATLFVLARGLVGHGGRLMRPGRVWGDDFFLKCEKLRQDKVGYSLTFVEVRTEEGQGRSVLPGTGKVCLYEFSMLKSRQRLNGSQPRASLENCEASLV